jgi:hypothetical protein
MSRLIALLLVLQGLFGSALPHVHCTTDCGHNHTDARPHVHLSGRNAEHRHGEDCHAHADVREVSEHGFAIAGDSHDADALFLGDETGNARRRVSTRADVRPAECLAPNRVTPCALSRTDGVARPAPPIRREDARAPRNGLLRV